MTMTAQTTSRVPSAAAPSLPSGSSAGPGSLRPLLDLRQVLDTLAMRILLAVSAVCIVGMAVLSTALQPLLIEDAPVLPNGAVIAVSLVLAVVLPVLCVLTVAGEWPGAIQSTFLLRPRRTAVLVSKVLAAVLIAIVVTAVSLALAVGLSALVGSVSGRGTSYEDLGSALLDYGLQALLAALFAIACAALLQGTALAMVIAVVVPFVVSIAASLVMVLASETIVEVMEYLDLSGAASAIANGEVEGSSIGAIVLLIVIPLVAGGVRWSRREIG
jgi:ABC-2 type transport system permease protein